jgi:hypothetical protein
MWCIEYRLQSAVHNHIHTNKDSDQVPLTRYYTKVAKIRWLLPLEDGRPIGCPKTSVRYYSYLLCNSPKECSSQDYFGHKNNAKNVSKGKIRNNTHTALIPILRSEACSSQGHRHVLVTLWLTCLCVARKCSSDDNSQATNQLLYDISLLQHGKGLTSGGNETGPRISIRSQILSSEWLFELT